MSLADDLLQQAKDLLDSSSGSDGRGRPRQANLRRAISTAYYSLFSLLVDAVATEVVGGGKKEKLLRGYVIRSISHDRTLTVCKGFASRNPEDPVKDVLAPHKISENLVDIAYTCCELQGQRHEADYNFVRIFQKEEAISLIDETAKAHKKWKAIKDHEATKVFLVALLVKSKSGNKRGGKDKDKAPVAEAEQC